MAQTVTFTSEKGGVGKTTTTVNTAAALAAAGYTVLVVDLDPQGNTSGLFQIERGENTTGIAQLLDPTDPAALADAIHDTGIARIDVIPAVRGHLQLVERTLGGEVGRETFLRTALKPVADIYDWVICDTAPNTGVLTMNAIVASDGVVAVSDHDQWAAEGAATIAGLVAKCARMPGITPAFLGILFNRVEPDRVLTSLVAEDVAASSLPVLTSQIRRREGIKQANYAHMPVNVYAPGSESAQEYEAAAAEIVALLHDVATPTHRDEAEIDLTAADPKVGQR
jgi:chromosome partitioning protein